MTRREELLRPELARLRAYQVPPSEGLIKLDAMENPYGWPPEYVDEWLALLRGVCPNRYPDPSARALKSALRRSAAIPSDAELLLGNGSDEIIQILLMALPPGAVVLAPEPTFVMYRQIAESLGLNFVGVPLEPEAFCLDLPAFLAAIDRYDPSLIFIADPNNPTGNLLPRDKVLSVLDRAQGLVVLDEAYTPFAGTSYLAELPIRPRLLIMRTLSKLGLAGLRLGYLCGAPCWLSEFEKLRLPYNISSLTQLTAEFALRHPEMLESQVAAILAQRQRVMTELRSLPNLKVYESAANFILLRVAAGRATPIFEGLKTEGLLIKNLHPQGGLLSDCLRVTIGTPAENDRFLSSFESWLRR